MPLSPSLNFFSSRRKNRMKTAVTLVCLCILHLVVGVTPFTVRESSSRASLFPPSVVLQAGKGFGSTPEPPKKKEPAPESSSSLSQDTDESPTTSISSSSVTTPPPPPNSGQRALAEMRRQRAEQKDAEFRKVREMLQADKQVEEAPAAIPERVAQRMGKRMLPFVGLPLFGGLGAFVLFWYLATYKDMEFQPSLVAFSTIAILVVSLLGITYSIMSASWDEDREGDLLGTDEFKKNLENIQEGLQRSRENTLLRENVARLNDGEVENALKDLERREKARAQPKTIGDKMKQDGLD